MLYKLAVPLLLGISTVQGIHIKGNRFYDDVSQKIVVLQGFSHSGTEFACVGGYGIFDGPTDDASIDQMKQWNINVVRIPLNEDCWLAINGV
jgi:endoglucanase